MGYKWIYLSENTPKTIGFSKIAFSSNFTNDNNLCLSTLPNRTSTENGQPNTEENGYPWDNRIWLGGDEGIGNIWICGHNISNYHPTIDVTSEIGDGKTWIAGNINPSRYICQEFPTSLLTALTLNMIAIYVNVPFEPSKSTFQFNSTGGSESFTIESSNNWTATTASDWVSLDNMTGTTGGTLVLTCNPNASDSARTATITFTDADANTFDITINQKKRGVWIPKAKVRKGALIVSKEYWNGTNPEPQPNDEIWYTSTSGQVVTPYKSSSTFGSGVHIVSNTYSGNKGIIKFDAVVSVVGYEAFSYCSGLTSISFPPSVTKLGPGTFCYCSGLTSVTIPDTITQIRDYTFSDCINLKRVICNSSTPPTLGNWVFDNNKPGRKIKVPSGSVDAYKAATNWSEYANDIISQ